MSKTNEVTIYPRGGGRLYGDFRPYGGKLEALIPTGSHDWQKQTGRPETLYP